MTTAARNIMNEASEQSARDKARHPEVFGHEQLAALLGDFVPEVFGEPRRVPVELFPNELRIVSYPSKSVREIEHDMASRLKVWPKGDVLSASCMDAEPALGSAVSLWIMGSRADVADEAHHLFIGKPRNPPGLEFGMAARTVWARHPATVVAEIDVHRDLFRQKDQIVASARLAGGNMPKCFGVARSTHVLAHFPHIVVGRLYGEDGEMLGCVLINRFHHAASPVELSRPAARRSACHC